MFLWYFIFFEIDFTTNASKLKESAPLVVKFRILPKNYPGTQNLVQDGRDYARFVT